MVNRRDDNENFRQEYYSSFEDNYKQYLRETDQEQWLYTDKYIQYLYSLDPKTRNKEFVSNFKNLEVIDIPEHGVPRIGKSNYENPKGWVNVDNQPPIDESLTYEDYVKYAPDFKDPYESNLVLHNNIYVVRDDLIPKNLGSKARYAESLMATVKEKYILYAMVSSGQAAKVLAATAKKYNKVVILIACLYKEVPKSHLEAMEHGAILMYYQSGGMAGVRKRCRAFINDQLNGQGLYVPAGVKHPVIVSGFAQSVNSIYNTVAPDVIFCASSTGVMAHGIYLGCKGKAEVHAVQVAGNSSLKKWPGKLVVYDHDQPFSERVKPEHAPPFPSIETYDAKAWKYALEYKKNNPDKIVMFWNVAGPHKIEDAK